MAPLPVLSGVLPHPLSGSVPDSTSAEPTEFSLTPFESEHAVRIHAEREFDLGAAVRRLWRTPPRAFREEALQIIPLGAYTYSAMVPGIASSTIGMFASDLLIVTNSFVPDPQLIAGADLAPSFDSYIATVNATTPLTLEVRREYLRSRFSVALAGAMSEDFEFGTDSQFSQRIARLVLRHGRDALGVLDATLTATRVPVSVLGELFRTLGRIRSASLHDDQRDILLRFLGAREVRVRHVAATGLAELDDPAAIPALQTALGKERSERLRMHLQQVLAQLQATDVAPRSR